MIYLIAGLIVGWMIVVYALARAAGSADEAAALLAEEPDATRPR